MRAGRASYKLSVLLVILLWGNSCSVEKNTNLSRFYHNLTSHYNIYFNGKESFEKGMERIRSARKDDYTTIMPLFEFNDKSAVSSAAADMDRAIQKASKVISLHSMTAKPERKNNDRQMSEKEKQFYERNDYNNWVDDSYLLLGLAQFMKHEFENARVTLLHNIRESSDSEMRNESQIWLARTYTGLDNYQESRRLVQELKEKPLSDRLMSDLLLTEADLFMQQGRYTEATQPLAAALKLIRGDSPKNRYTYILARLYEETRQSQKAEEAYRAVLKLNPPYELEFNARINQAGVFDIESGDIESLKRELKRLLRDVKNKEYLDQIYFALGNLSKREGEIDQAVEYYKLSASSSTVNGNQKGKSYLMLADHFFKLDDYLSSQVYYDSAVTFLSPEYPGYDEFHSRSVNLNELASYISSVTREDSLQYVASLPEAQRQSLINGIIREIEAQERQQSAELDDRYNMGQFYENQRRFTDNVDVSGKWYFYNQAALTFGRTEFRNRWGQRKLEDNWRRRNRATASGGAIIDPMAGEAEQEVLGPNDLKSPEYYLRNLPLSDSLVEISNDRIAIALFNAGKIFSDRFGDSQNATDYFASLVERFPEHPLVPGALYSLYNLNINRNPSYAELQKEQLISRYPDSDFARILSDPDYFETVRRETEREENIYNSAWEAWERDDRETVIAICDNALQEFPDGELKPRFMLLRAYALAQLTDERTLKAELQKIMTGFPGTAEAERASELIAHINREVPELKAEEEEQIAREIYSPDMTGQHIFVVIIKERNLDINRLTFDVINFNIDNHTNENYSTRGELVDNLYIMITVSSLADALSALSYYNSFVPSEVLHNYGEAEIMTFLITPANLETFKRDKDPDRYMIFFRQNYLRLPSDNQQN